jgi:N-acyl-D-aspartate/D-glutamate deacylase
LRSYQQGDRRSAASSEEAGFFAAAPPINDDADFMLHLLRQFDRALRWYVITANQRPEVLRELLFDPQTLPGFNDSGAHLTNMAYFDGNLSTLKMAAQESLDQVSLAVKRLTRDPARLFRMEVGTLEMAAQADLILVDPQALLDYDSDAGLTMIHREVFDHPQLVNRSDGVVDKVWIAGKLAWDGATFTPEVGKERFGRLMTARAQAAA